MRSLLKYGISVLALTVGLGAANAQNQEEKRPQMQNQVERPDAGGAEQQGDQKKRGGNAEKRQSNDAMQGKGDERKERMGQGEDRKDGKERMDRADDRKDTKERVGQSEDRKDDVKRPDNRERGDQMQKDRKDGKQAQSGKRHSKEQVKNVQITKEKKTVIRERIFQRAPKRYTRNEINFNISVGSAIPSSFVVYDIPPTFVEIVPEFEGYDYIIVGDVVLIVDPDTREIVDVVDV